MHDIVIKRVRNGVIVHVGCQTFVSESVTVALEKIRQYLLEPKAVQKWWDENFPPLDLNEPERLHLEPRKSPLTAVRESRPYHPLEEAPDEPSL